MGFNSKFEDLMDGINNIAQGYGYKNGVDWASEAQKSGYLTYEKFKEYENTHKLRVRFSHGNAKDINISQETYQVVKNFLCDIKNSNLRKRVQFNSEKTK